MPSLHLRIRLETDVIMSASSATVGGHHTLQRLTGRSLLGACAAVEYGARGFDVFHSGKVRFGDAFPESDGEVALPVPLSLYRAKTGPASDPRWNLAVAERPRGIQLEQERDGHIRADGHRQAVPRSYTMRTAVEDHGAARAGFLFGIESIAAGATFRATVSADTDDLLQEVEKRLVNRHHRLGRSRSAEFGLVRIERCDDTPWLTVEGVVDEVRIWCLSDIALRDAATGVPRLLPTPDDFGIAGEWRSDRSFIRFNRLTPFNTHRRSHDMERQLIAAGSVIVFRAPGTDLGALRDRLASGVGDYQVEGCGRVLVQPLLLESPRVTISERADKRPPTSIQRQAIPADNLGAWLLARLNEDMLRERAWDLSRDWERALRRFRVGAAQWGELRHRAGVARIQGTSRDTFAEQLGRDLKGVNPSTKHKAGQGVTALRWAQHRIGGKSAADVLLALLVDSPKEIAVVTTELLASRIVRRLHRAEADKAGEGTSV